MCSDAVRRCLLPAQSAFVSTDHKYFDSIMATKTNQGRMIMAGCTAQVRSLFCIYCASAFGDAQLLNRCAWYRRSEFLISHPAACSLPTPATRSAWCVRTDAASEFFCQFRDSI